MELQITDVAFGGKGVARANGKALFVPYVVDGVSTSDSRDFLVFFLTGGVGCICTDEGMHEPVAVYARPSARK